MRDDTLVLFCADNGSPRGVVSLWEEELVQGGKQSGMECDFATHVPLIASWTGTSPVGAVSDALVDLSDFLPTLCDLAGIPPGPAIDGKSFAPDLLGTGRSGREWVYWPQQRGCARDRRYRRRPCPTPRRQQPGIQYPPSSSRDIRSCSHVPDHTSGRWRCESRRHVHVMGDQRSAHEPPIHRHRIRPTAGRQLSRHPIFLPLRAFQVLRLAPTSVTVRSQYII